MPPRKKHTGYRPPRNTREVLIAVGAAVAVVVVTIALIWFFAPDDSDTNNPVTPPIQTQSAPTSMSTAPSNTPAPSSVPPSSEPTTP
jgi:hypothetical protein